MLLSSILRRAALSMGIVVVSSLTAHAQSDTFEGPTSPRGIAFETLGSIDLAGEFPDVEEMADRDLRVRYWTIQPGGIVPVHSHDNRPAILYVLSGEILEHRSDDDQPHVHSAGDVSLEGAGVQHWWENTSDQVVELLAVDIVQN